MEEEKKISYFIIDLEEADYKKMKRLIEDPILQHKFRLRHINGEKYRAYVCAWSKFSALKVLTVNVYPESLGFMHDIIKSYKIYWEGKFDENDMDFGEGLYKDLDPKQPYTHYTASHPFYWKLKANQLDSPKIDYSEGVILDGIFVLSINSERVGFATSKVKAEEFVKKHQDKYHRVVYDDILSFVDRNYGKKFET